MKTARHIVITLLLALLATACGSFRDTRPLEDRERAEVDALVAELDGLAVGFRSGDLVGEFLASRELDVVPAWSLNEEFPEESPGEGPDGNPSGREALFAFVDSCPGIADSGLTYWTFGVFPWGGDATPRAWIQFASSPPESASTVVRVDAYYVLGWFGLPAALLPRWSTFSHGIGNFVPFTDAQAERLGLLVARELAEAARERGRSLDDPAQPSEEFRRPNSDATSRAACTTRTTSRRLVSRYTTR